MRVPGSAIGVLLAVHVALSACDSSAPVEQSPNGAPVLAAQATDTTVLAGRFFQIALTASDPDGDSLSVQIPERPSWCGAVGSTGSAMLTCRPVAESIGRHTIMATASDAEATTVLELHITVVDELAVPGNTAPAFSPALPHITVAAGEDTSVAIKVSDPEGDYVTVSPVSLPAWCAFENKGSNEHAISCSPGKSDVGRHTVELEAADNAGGSTRATFTITVTEPLPHGPVPAGSVIYFPVELDRRWTYAYTSSDNKSGTITWEIVDVAQSADTTRFVIRQSTSIAGTEATADLDGMLWPDGALTLRGFYHEQEKAQQPFLVWYAPDEPSDALEVGATLYEGFRRFSQRSATLKENIGITEFRYSWQQTAPSGSGRYTMVLQEE